MAELERKDIWSDELLDAPNRYVKALENAIVTSERLIKVMQDSEKNIQMATSISKISQEADKLTKAQIKLEEAQKSYADGINKVNKNLDDYDRYLKSVKENTGKFGTVVNQADVAMGKAAEKARQWGEAVKKSSEENKKAEQVTKQKIETEQKELSELEKLISKRTELQLLIKGEQEAVKTYNQELKNGIITEQEHAQALSVNNELIFKYNEQLKAVNQDIKDHTVLEGRDAKEINGKNASLKQLEAALAKNRRAYAALSDEQKRNSKEGQSLLKIIQQQDKESKALSKTIGINNKEVGNYTESIKQALSPLTGMLTGTAGLGLNLGATSAGFQKGAKGANLFSIALRAIPIFAIIGAVTSLIAYFKGTEEGAQRLRIIMAAVGQVFTSLKDVLIDFGKRLFDALSNPKQAAIDLGKAIVDNIQNRIQGTIELFIAAKDAGIQAWKILKEYLSGGVLTVDGQKRIEEAKNKLSEIGSNAVDSLGKAALGVSDITKKVEEMGKEFGKFYDETASKVDRAIKLQELENALIVAKREFIVEEARLTRDINEQREKGADQLLVEEERLEALVKARELMDELESARLKKAEKELFIAKERAKLSHADESSLESIAELEAEVLRIESQRYQQGLRLTRQISGLQIQIIQRDKEAALLRIKDREDEAKRTADLIIQQKQRELDAEIWLIQQAVANGTKIRGDAEREIAIIRRRYANEGIEEAITQMQQLLDFSKETEQEKINVILNSGLKEAEKEKELSRIRREAADEQVQIYNKIHDLQMQLSGILVDQSTLQLENTIQKLEQIQFAYTAFAEQIGAIFNNITEARLQNIDREIAALEKQTEREIELAGDNERAKEEIQLRADARREQLEERRRAEQRRAAVRQKASALIEAGINIAVAYTKALAQGGFVLGIPMATVIAALGAVQLAAIASQPIPQFAEGGITSTPLVIAGEKGRELYRTPSGVVGLTPDKATLMKMPLGTEIIPHDETMKMLALSGIRQDVSKDYAIMEQIKSLEQTVSRGNKELIKAVIESAPGDLFMQGSLVYEGRRRADGSRKLIRRKTFGY